MDSLLIISGSDKGVDNLSGLILAMVKPDITTARSGSEAGRLLLKADFDMVIINAPLTDEFGDELAQRIADGSTAGVILIVNSTLADEIAYKVEEHGVFVVPKPLRRELFYQTIRMANVARNRMLGLQKKNIKLQQKIENIRLVDRAKYTLMQYLNMTEPQAHRYIEKRAMDMRMTKHEVAENILKTYET